MLCAVSCSASLWESDRDGAAELPAAHEVRLKAADLEIEEDTERQLSELQQALQKKLDDEEKTLSADAGAALQQLESYYRENRQALADSIYNSIIRK